MKKYIIYLIIFVVVFNMAGCGSYNESSKNTTNKFEMKKAEDLVDLYIRDLIAGDSEGVKKILTDELNKNEENISKSALKVKGYSMDESYQVGDTGVFKVKVTSIAGDLSKTSLDSYTIKTIMQNWNYKISDIQVSTEKESYFENYGLRLRNKNNVKSELLIDNDGIPQYSFSKEDKANVNKIEIPRTNFNSSIFGYSGDNIALSTVGNNLSYIAIVKIQNNTVSTGSTQSSSGGDQAGSSSAGAGEAAPSVPGPREVPLGKDITSIDVLKDIKIDFMVFSPDEKFLLVQYTKSNMKNVNIYITENGNMIPFKFEENYNTNNVDIIYSYFNKDKLYFQVIPKEEKKNIEKSTTGTWQMDLKKFNVKKI